MMLTSSSAYCISTLTDPYSPCHCPRPITTMGLVSYCYFTQHYFIVNDFSSCQCIIFCLVAYVNL